jgi:hypothetical protein
LLPPQAVIEAMMVNGFDLTITHEETGKVIYHNACIS